MAISKKGKKKLKGKITKKTTTPKSSTTTSKSGNVSVNVKIGEDKKTKKGKGKKKPKKKTGAMFGYNSNQYGRYVGATGGYGYGSLGMGGFNNPYAQSDMIAQTAQRAVYDALGNRSIVGERANIQPPSVAEQQAAVQAQELRAEVEPIRPAGVVPPPPPSRAGDPYYEAEVLYGEQQRAEDIRRGRRPPAAAARPTLSRPAAAATTAPILKRSASLESPGGTRQTFEQTEFGTFADVRADIPKTRKENESSADLYGGYVDETLRSKKTRGAKQGLRGVESNAQEAGSGGGMGLLQRYREKFRKKKVAPALYQDADLLADGGGSPDWDDIRTRRLRQLTEGGGAGELGGEEDESKAETRGRRKGQKDRVPRKRRTNLQLAGAELGGMYGAIEPAAPRPSRAERMKRALGMGVVPT